MAGVVGKLEAEMEVKSNADKFWSSIKDFATIFPNTSPSIYKGTQIIQGDGKAPGSLMKVTLDIGHELDVKTVTERIEDVDDAKRTIIYSVIDGDLLKYLKSYKGYISVTPKGDDNGSIVKWSCEYVKASQEVPEPILIKEFAYKIFPNVDDYLLSK
ncbi:MLP-like protein 423 [Arachis duranensis]|uniref:MLP-like protein 423 n=1 Tax=Arachis duranensis TaxID=130453 RepID=A0A6P4CV28_ARADU|nr:MLP-like protein 423 [Arachis duranensis]